MVISLAFARVVVRATGAIRLAPMIAAKVSFFMFLLSLMDLFFSVHPSRSTSYSVRRVSADDRSELKSVNPLLNATLMPDVQFTVTFCLTILQEAGNTRENGFWNYNHMSATICHLSRNLHTTILFMGGKLPIGVFGKT